MFANCIVQQRTVGQTTALDLSLDVSFLGNYVRDDTDYVSYGGSEGGTVAVCGITLKRNTVNSFKRHFYSSMNGIIKKRSDKTMENLIYYYITILLHLIHCTFAYILCILPMYTSPHTSILFK